MKFVKNRPNIVLVVDCSGSMNREIATMQQHISSLIQSADNGEFNANIGVAPFDDTVFPINWEGSLFLHHGGGTNLYGACIRNLRELQQIATASDKVMVIVITDGAHGGGSDKFTPSDVKAEVGIAEEMLGWDFLFVGTNQNAYAIGQQLGIKPGKALSFANSSTGFEQMLSALADIAKRWTGGHISHEAEFFSTEVKESQSKLGAIVV